MKILKKFLTPSCFKIAVSITVAIVALYLLSPAFLEIVELKALDVRFKSRPRIKPGDEVVILTIDEKSLDELGRWPWPRSIIARLIDSLTAYEVKVMGFDIVFAEPSQDKKEDARLAKAVKDSGRVILGHYFSFGRENHGIEGRELDNYYDVKTMGNGQNITSGDGIVGNIEQIAEGAAGFGYFNIVPDVDGGVRWDPLAINYRDRYYPPLALQTLRHYLGDPPLSITLADFGVARLKLGNLSIPIDEEGRMIVNYYGGQKTFPHYSISDAIFNRIPREQLKDKIVLIGSTAVGIYDMRVTPFEATYPGVEIHATVIDNILHERFISRPKWLSIIDIFVIIAMGLTLGVVIPRLSAWLGFAVAISILAFYLLLNLYIFSNQGLWINGVYPSLVVVLAYPGIILFKYITEEKEKKWIKGAFQYYVTESVMDEILKNPDMLKLGGEERELTVLFSDIRGFTTISEQLSPEKLVSLLNEYLTAMTDIVFEYRGYLDKYIGDAVMVVYGAPLPQEDHSRQACVTALKMMTELKLLQEKWEKEGLPFLDIGIGINTGPMVIGNMGSKRRFNYTVMGDSVNLASRLEGLNKNYGTHIIVSEKVYENVRNEFLCRELDMVTVKGKTEPSKIYELMGRIENTTDIVEMVEIFHQGLALYRNSDWENAIKRFERVLEIKPADKPSEIFIKRSQHILEGLKTDPNEANASS